MIGEPTDFWGKFERREDGCVHWHPLIDHCADVAAVCEALLRFTLIRKRLATLDERDDLSEVDVQRLCALAALHDTGKFNRGFQNKSGFRQRPKPAGHVQPLLALFGNDSAEQRRLKVSMPLDEIEQWGLDNSGIELLIASIAHHGRPGQIGGVGPNVELWRAESGGLDPFDGIRRLSERVRRWFPKAFSSAPALPANPRFQHAFCGLVTLADWIGSDRSAFPFSQPDEPDRISFARSRAEIVLRRMAMDPTAARTAPAIRAFHFRKVFGFEANAAQRRMHALPVEAGGSLSILESETGSGKTEAALARFFRLFAAGLVDGMYFALPTRTAAVQMHGRISDAIAGVFADVATRPPVILAVPGYIRLDDARDPALLERFESLFPDDEAARWRFRKWASEHPKRYLAGAVSVGTVDQALLSSLAVAHSHLRASSLLRQFLVVDEVHASDAYMSAVLHEVLRFHLAAGGHALLLSATLGSRAAARLLGAAQAAVSPLPLPPLTEARDVPYPVLTTVVRGRGYPDREVLATDSATKMVAIQIIGVAADFAATAAMAVKAALGGARVMIVRNTVRDCVATQIELEKAAAARHASECLFHVNCIPAPHHSRFAREDRETLDLALEGRFGRDSGGPCVLAATQTVQQSLDLDADLLLTDLCPLDVMLQRIGRLHRHSRQRPEPFRCAQAIVLTPADRDLSSLIQHQGEARGPHGLGTVYGDLRILEATWRALELTPTLKLPAMNRRLVEEATHPEALKAIVDGMGGAWKRHATRCDGFAIAGAGVARLNCVDRDNPYSDCRFPTSESHISARLGNDDRIAEFAGPLSGPFGSPIRRLAIPGWLVRGAPADAEVEDVVSQPGVVRFRFAGRTFTYDRLGLRPTETPSNDKEDLG